MHNLLIYQLVVFQVDFPISFPLALIPFAMVSKLVKRIEPFQVPLIQVWNRNCNDDVNTLPSSAHSSSPLSVNPKHLPNI